MREQNNVVRELKKGNQIMRTYIYAETTFQIYKTKGGTFIPLHKSPFSKNFEYFKENGATVIRNRKDYAEKYIQRKAKVANPPIEFVDGSLPSEEEQHLQQYRDLLVKKLDKSHMVSLSISELNAFHREINITFNWLIMNNVSDQQIEQIEVEAGLY